MDTAAPSGLAEAPSTGKPRWLNPDEQKAWRAWLYSAQLLMDRLDRELIRDTGMPHAYYEILAQLSEPADRMLRMSQLEVVPGLVELEVAVPRLTPALR